MLAIIDLKRFKCIWHKLKVKYGKAGQMSNKIKPGGKLKYDSV